VTLTFAAVCKSLIIGSPESSEASTIVPLRKDKAAMTRRQASEITRE
jgi:hypothetical protein